MDIKNLSEAEVFMLTTRIRPVALKWCKNSSVGVHYGKYKLLVHKVTLANGEDRLAVVTGAQEPRQYYDMMSDANRIAGTTGLSIYHITTRDKDRPLERSKISHQRLFLTVINAIQPAKLAAAFRGGLEEESITEAAKVLMKDAIHIKRMEKYRHVLYFGGDSLSSMRKIAVNVILGDLAVQAKERFGTELSVSILFGQENTHTKDSDYAFLLGKETDSDRTGVSFYNKLVQLDEFEEIMNKFETATYVRYGSREPFKEAMKFATIYGGSCNKAMAMISEDKDIRALAEMNESFDDMLAFLREPVDYQSEYGLRDDFRNVCSAKILEGPSALPEREAS